MTEAQQRALWAVAIHDIADAVRDGKANPPTSIDLWTQDVSTAELLGYADNSYSKSLPILVMPTHASVTIPTGEILGLPITWHITTSLNVPEAAGIIDVFALHNLECCGEDADPSRCVASKHIPDRGASCAVCGTLDMTYADVTD